MRLIIQPDYANVSQWAANYVASRINAFAPTEEKPFILGLPTGSSPLGMYKALIELNPYNDRLHVGLPPSPICQPNAAMIEAAMNPTPGNWLYFVTVNLDTGETQFTNSEQQFQQYKAQYDAWLKAHPNF